MKYVVIYSLIWALLSFYLYWPLFFSMLRKGKSRGIVLARLYGGLLFGGAPIIILLVLKADVLNDLGLCLPEGPDIWHFVSLLMIILIVPISYFQSKSSSNLVDFPQIRDSNWNFKLVIVNSASWMFYLIGYEILFRGFLLFPLIDELSLGLAITINLLVYSMSHAAKRFREGLATIPIGLLLFLIAWKTNSIVYPIVIHWFIALSNSFFSVRHHPDMVFIKTRKV